MEIEQKITRFVEILKMRYVATGNTEIFVSNRTLEESGLGDTLWSVICPLLRTQKVLIEFSNPNDDASELMRSIYFNPKYHGFTIAEQGLDVIKARELENFDHRFVVDPDMLFAPKTSDKESGHIVMKDVPEGTKWIDIQFQFTGRHSIHVSVPTKSWAQIITPKDLGLERESGRPMKKWAILQELAENGGKLSLKHMLKGESKRRQLTGLGRLIEAVFPNVEGASIQPTDSGNEYECVFTIIPEQEE